MRVGHVIAAAVGFSAAVLFYEGRALVLDTSRAWGVVAGRIDADAENDSQRKQLRERFDTLPDDEKARVIDEIQQRRADKRDGPRP